MIVGEDGFIEDVWVGAVVAKDVGEGVEEIWMDVDDDGFAVEVPVSVVLAVDFIVVVEIIVEVVVGMTIVVVSTVSSFVVENTTVDGVLVVVEQFTVTQHTFIL